VLGHGGNERRERRKRWSIDAYQAREKGCDKDSNQMAHNTTEDFRQLKSDAKQSRTHTFSRQLPSERTKASKLTWLIPEAAEDA
jgi:hypothetical protein